MILMRAIVQFITPDRCSSQFIGVAALGHNEITRAKSILLSFVAFDGNGLDLFKIQIPILDVRDAKIRHVDSISQVDPASLRCSGSNGRYFVKRSDGEFSIDAVTIAEQF